MLLATLGVSLRRVKKSKIPGQRVIKKLCNTKVLSK